MYVLPQRCAGQIATAGYSGSKSNGAVILDERERGSSTFGGNSATAETRVGNGRAVDATRLAVGIVGPPGV